MCRRIGPLAASEAGLSIQYPFVHRYERFSKSDIIVFAAPIYWWHICAQLKTFVDRMHPMLTFDREHCLTTKRLIFHTAYFAQDPYGVELAIKMFESIAGWAGMGFDALCYHSPNGHVRDNGAKMAEAFELGKSFRAWQKPELTIPCPIKGCGFRFPNAERLAMHLIMAAGDSHLDWKAEHLSATYTLENTQELKIEVLRFLPSILEDIGH